MIRNRCFYLPVLLVLAVTVISMSLTTGNKRSKAVDGIAQLYRIELQRFDSMLTEYPKYFLDSAYSLRCNKFGQIAYQLKRVEALFAYLHPKTAYETFLKTPQFEAREVGPPFPDNWLILGPFGIDPDSSIAKWSQKDIEFTKMFIGRAAKNFSKLLSE